MLVLTFRVARIIYAVPVSQVIEVVPRVELRQGPHAPPCFIGLLHYRGTVVPVIDLGLLLGYSACIDRLDTRILLVRTSQEDRPDHRLGLLAEQVNELLDLDEARGASCSSMMLTAPYLAAVYETDLGLLQLIDPKQITVSTVSESQGIIAP